MKKEQKGNEKNSAEKKLPDMNDKPVKKPKPKRKKRKKHLKTPSHILRLCMVWMYVILIFMLSFSYVTMTLYIKDDMSIGNDLSNADLHYATQKEIDSATQELEKALGALQKSGEKSVEYESALAISSADFQWKYHIASDVDAKKLLELIGKSRELDRVAYTENTVKAVNDATLKAQHTLCATVTISQSALQIVLGGVVNDTPTDAVSDIIVSGIIMYALVLLPVIGFFFASFDKKRHLKNVYTIICCIACLFMIFFAIYPSIGIGAVISVILYIILFFMSAGSIYAIQQERYIVKHPELEAEFTEKHPYFVKALINYKSVTLTENIRQQEEEEKEKKLRETKKKKKK